MSELAAKELYIRQISIPHEIPADNYVAQIPIVQHLMRHSLELHKPVTIFVGENGIGKSTLIEAIAVAMRFNAEGGSKSLSFATQATHSSLHAYLRTAKGWKSEDGFFLRAESFYNVATIIDELDKEPSFGPPLIDSYGGKSLHAQSHGESFMALMENRFGGNGLYILDEPEAALSPMRLMRMMYIMHDLIQRESQFIISTHSPLLMMFPGADILQCTQDGIARVRYQDTEHYQITRMFMDNPDRMFHYLFTEEAQ
ncbi:MAG: AAA family ATPase [Peptococcaceae bacterium]|nr:AAA family ATPase [Peptococcaceae bacterium]